MLSFRVGWNWLAIGPDVVNFFTGRVSGTGQVFATFVLAFEQRFAALRTRKVCGFRLLAFTGKWLCGLAFRIF
jgi:hypothetical protein